METATVPDITKEEADEYIKKEGLNKLIDFAANIDYKEKPRDHVSGQIQKPFPPEPIDLVRLHKLIRARKSFTVLEFGTGYSTVIMADALHKNSIDWHNNSAVPEVRNRFMFKLFCVDNEAWIAKTKAMLPKALKNIVSFTASDVHIGTYNGQLCHYFDVLPNIVPDFIYLDGPPNFDVQGEIHGLSFKCEERTVLAADLLLMESTFLPGTFIIVDGRTNNVRFLQRNFTRNYKVIWNKIGDVTTFELDEPRLGKYNILGSDYFK